MNHEYIEISPGSEQAHTFRTPFINLYKEVFSGAPFYERFTNEEVASIYDDLMQQNGFLCCVIHQGQLIAFGTGMPLAQLSAELRQICQKYLPPEDAFYNSDVATHPDYRNQGIGSTLIEKRLGYARNKGYRYSVFRTNREGSMSAPLYQRLGFQTMEETTWVTQPRTRPDMSDTDERIIMWKAL